MEDVLVRKIGNSIGIILPKESDLRVGDVVGYKQDGEKIILDIQNVGREHDRELIEDSFKNFSMENSYSEEKMKEKFGEHSWGSQNT
ncbi:AbrB family transcriptional regulator [Enterococcus sp. JM4C]|uniref:AbrB/MazE/SpoVT family DNA-binding domain-containing protein n=1 Tax=Candidatus Enterococcus huntleyi TaxID=1857217 RepID=UPI00137B3EE3|nr:AbrB family transcriptional regulator [Enterococcus sp. JM4C]KAF1297821.1 AbrB family transcriptional regulator [Enterococcus sp. JM4C]